MRTISDEPLSVNPAHRNEATDRGYEAVDASSAVELVAITKNYGHVCALAGVSLTIRQGSFVTLLGPSGSGKSTMLHVIAGFVQPDSGRLLLDGVDATTVPAHRRGLGLVFQHFALFPHMTVRENIAYGLRLRGYGRLQRAQAVARYLELVDLEHVIDRRPDELSGGQRQRVALARALAFQPEIVLLDEALGALDKRLRQTLQFEMKTIQRSVGATFIHVTHDQDEALALSDEIVLLNNGGVMQIGTPTELYDAPNSLFIADFMGEMNQLDVTIERLDTEAMRLHPPGSVEEILITRATRQQLSCKRKEAVACIRPERIVLGEVDDWVHLHGTVRSHIFMGDHRRYEVMVGASALIMTETTASPDTLSEGSEITVSVKPEDIRLFDRDDSSTTPKGDVTTKR